MRRHSLALALIAAGTSASADIARETDRHERKRVMPGERVERAAECRDGALVSGGYWLAGAEAGAFAVVASFPLADGRWRVIVENVSDEAQALTLRTYALCDVD